MGLYSYSIIVPKEARIAKAQVHDVDASYKDLGQVLGAIKGKTVAQATQLLDLCISRKKAIPFRKFAKHLGHRSELGGRKGKYPIKEARIALQLLDNAVANANAKGLDKSALVIYGASAHKQNVFMRYRRYWASGIVLGYGKQAFASKYVTCWAELVLLEKTTPQKTEQAKHEKKSEKAENKTENATGKKKTESKKQATALNVGKAEKPTTSKEGS